MMYLVLNVCFVSSVVTARVKNETIIGDKKCALVEVYCTVPRRLHDNESNVPILTSIANYFMYKMDEVTVYIKYNFS